MNDDLQQNLVAGKIVLGGCVVEEDAPKWQCVDCEQHLGIN
ncbi:hypothetical protein N8000_05310 [Rhodospirillales bacterium]|nr:hypothetical protein [Rhodospirillales bacterium]